eukprot:tig00001286_g8023.t1
MARRGAASAARKVLYMREYRTTERGLELSRARHAAFKRDARAVLRKALYLARYRRRPQVVAKGPVPRGDILVIGLDVVVLFEGDEHEHGELNVFYWTGNYVPWVEKERLLKIALDVARWLHLPLHVVRLNLHSRRRWTDMERALNAMEAALRLPAEQAPQAGQPRVQYFGYSRARLDALASATRPEPEPEPEPEPLEPLPDPLGPYEELPAWLQLEVDAARALPGYDTCRLQLQREL